MAFSGSEHFMQGQQAETGEAPVALYLALCLTSLLVFPAAQWISASTSFSVPRAVFAGLLAGHLCLAIQALHGRCISLLAVTTSLLALDIYAIFVRL